MQSFSFSNKTVYLLSPERWGTMKVSKHHYALELAERGCRIFFIEPPSLAHKGISIVSCDDHPAIKLVRYKPIFRGRRFLPRIIYTRLLKIQVSKLLKAIGTKPDVLWCFHAYLFEDLRCFKAAVNIFFAADQFFSLFNPPEVKTATISVGVSDTIYERLKQSTPNAFQINHGLQQRFVKEACELLNNKTYALKAGNKLVAGYTGNLMMEALDRNVMRHVIIDNPSIQFLFWGSYDKNDLNLGGITTSEASEFIEFLQQQDNVRLKGVVNTGQLQEQMKEADIFWLCWDITRKALWDGSNSHKILEYLSTGKPVVSHYMSSYKNTGLLYMLSSNDNEKYAEMFSNSIKLVQEGEQASIIEQRLRCAIDNSYTEQLHRLEKLVAENI